MPGVGVAAKSLRKTLTKRPALAQNTQRGAQPTRDAKRLADIWRAFVASLIKERAEDGCE